LRIILYNIFNNLVHDMFVCTEPSDPWQHGCSKVLDVGTFLNSDIFRDSQFVLAFCTCFVVRVKL
jgi:hypothetical protein